MQSALLLHSAALAALLVPVRATLPLSPSIPAPGPWTPTLIEDFSGTSLNTSLWHPRINETHCAPCELELYVDSALAVANSNLIITTAREQILGPGGKLFNFSSGWVDSKGSFAQEFGIFEVRAKLPAQNAPGAWPAHWLMPASDVCWPVGGEIDIMEATSNPVLNQVYGSYRWGTACGGDKQVLPGAAFPPLGAPPIDWAAEYHTFSVWWNASALSFYVDGTLYETKTSAQVCGVAADNPAAESHPPPPLPLQVNLPTGPMYIILNTAVAPYMPPGPDAKYPTTHTVDWVQVWQLQGA
jgi:beta-glucanase (GH16 family)